MNAEEKICENCKFLFISGMFQDWGGTAGYCLLIRGRMEVTKKSQVDSIRQITDTCSKFEKKEKR